MSSKFFKTTFVIEVLSEDTDVSNLNLHQIAYAITEGDCSGDIKSTAIIELNKKQVEDALIEQGSSPDFFNLGMQDEDEDEYLCPECGATSKVVMVDDSVGNGIIEARECPLCGWNNYTQN